MTSRTHDIIAFGSLLTVTAYFPPESLTISTVFACIIGNIIGSLVPDMDQSANRLWDLLPAGNTVGRILRKLFISHRTISHSLLGIYLMYYILLFVIPKIINTEYINSSYLITAIMTGFISHIAADSLTKEGIPLFFPFNFRIGIPPFKILRINTGGFMEKFVIFPLVIIFIFWLITQKSGVFLSLAGIINH